MGGGAFRHSQGLQLSVFTKRSHLELLRNGTDERRAAEIDSSGSYEKLPESIAWAHCEKAWRGRWRWMHPCAIEFFDLLASMVDRQDHGLFATAGMCTQA